MGDYDEDAAELRRKARRGCVETWQGMHWDHWVVFRLGGKVDEITASAHLERLIHDIDRAHYRAVRILAGFHRDPFPHIHALISLSRRLRRTLSAPVSFQVWLQPFWRHGEVIVEVYDPSRRSPQHGGAIEYTVRDPGTVVFSDWVR